MLSTIILDKSRNQTNQTDQKNQITTPLILTGDFNTSIEEESIKNIMNILNLQNMFPLPWTTWKERPPTSWQPGSLVRHAIDHFLVNDAIKPCGFLDVPSDDEVKASGLLPGISYPSDHLVICMDFGL